MNTSMQNQDYSANVVQYKFLVGKMLRKVEYHIVKPLHKSLNVEHNAYKINDTSVDSD